MARSLIDSVGIALPSQVVTTREVLAGCRRPPKLPFELMTGIVSRRVVDDTEYAIDLAFRAARDCFARSAITPRDVDLVISTSISRYDAPGCVTYEPATAARLCQALGCLDAWAFDVTNACAGNFTGIHIADTLIRLGRIGTALVVSGEYITHLMRTAQWEIAEELDPRLSCLTLGDAGSAILLTRGDDSRTGFEHISLRTIGRHHALCVAGPTDGSRGGAIMKTDMLALSEAGVREGVAHTTRMMRSLGLSIEDIDRVIPHQTSLLTIRSVIRHLNKALGTKTLNDTIVINNLAERGNTSTTTHIVALYDGSRDRRIQTGQRLMFGIAGSGINVGNAVYTLDDLPQRLARNAVSTRPPPQRPRPSRQPPIQIAGVGLALPDGRVAPTTLGLIDRATTECLSMAGVRASTVDTFIHAGVYRSGLVAEPAIAAIAAGELGFDGSTAIGGNVLGFDLTNGGLGVLDACRVASALIEAGQATNALVAASEVEEREPGDPQTPLAAAGSALLLHASPERQHGFLGFHTRRYGHLIDRYSAWATHDPGQYFIRSHSRTVLEEHYIEYLPVVVAELCDALEIAPSSIRAVLPPSVASDFTVRLRARWSLADRIVDLSWSGGDLFTSAIPVGLHRILAEGDTTPGDLVILTAVASGVQIGAAIYRC